MYLSQGFATRRHILVNLRCSKMMTQRALGMELSEHSRGNNVIHRDTVSFKFGVGCRSSLMRILLARASVQTYRVSIFTASYTWDRASPGWLAVIQHFTDL